MPLSFFFPISLGSLVKSKFLWESCWETIRLKERMIWLMERTIPLWWAKKKPAYGNRTVGTVKKVTGNGNLEDISCHATVLSTFMSSAYKTICNTNYKTGYFRLKILIIECTVINTFNISPNLSKKYLSRMW